MFPAYALGLVVVTFWNIQERGHYYFINAINECGRHKVLIEAVQHSNNRVIPKDVCTQWLAGALPERDFWGMQLGKPELDPWGIPYRCVRDFHSKNGQTIDLGVYSCGEDRISTSEGEDQDDLNTWDPSTGSSYAREIKYQMRLTNMIEGIVVAPFVYVILLTCIRLAKRMCSMVWPRL